MNIFDATKPVQSASGAGGGIDATTELSDRARRLLSYWQGLRQAPALKSAAAPDAKLSKRRLPGRADFDPIDLPDLLSGIWLVETVDETGTTPLPRGPRFRCRLYSAHLSEVFGRDLTGKLLDAPGLGFAGTDAEEDFKRVVDTGTPRWWRGPITMTVDRFSDHVEVIMLPLAADGVRVDMILCFATPL